MKFPENKTKIFKTEIIRLANNGKGVGKAPDGKTVFVPGAVPGDRLQVEVTAEKSRLYEAKIAAVLSPSPDRIEADCPDYERCGGCCFRQMTYERELEAKAGFVRDAFRRLGGFEIALEPIIPSPATNAYRNKVEFAIGTDPEGNLFPGFNSEKTHRIIPADHCRLMPDDFLKISEFFFKLDNLKKFTAWDPKTGEEILRQLILRKSGLTGDVMLIIVTASDNFPGGKAAAEAVRAAFPQVTSVMLNIHREENGPALSTKTRILSGAAFIRDQICGVPVEIGPLSFFQVNTPAAELLYQTAAEYAQVQPDDSVLDLYCGMGTIGLSMAAGCRQLISGEIVSEAVESAKRNAAVMGLTNTRFLCGDAGEIARTLTGEGIHPDLIILDPPRRGCSPETLQAVLTLTPDRIVMVSCDPATAARDCRVLCDASYILTRLRPVDLFPRTKHVETVCCLYHQKKDFISVPYEPKNAESFKQG